MTRSKLRLRARRVDEESLSRYIATLGKRSDDGWIANVIHGGRVANAYKYPADTECALAVSNPAGIVVVWLTRTHARGVTLRGAAKACLRGAGDLWDGRVNQERKDDAWVLLKSAFTEAMPIVDQLAALVEVA